MTFANDSEDVVSFGTNDALGTLMEELHPLHRTCWVEYTKNPLHSMKNVTGKKLKATTTSL